MTARATLAILLLLSALAGALPGPAQAASPDAFDLRNRAGSVGRLPRVVVDDGTAYVPATRLASLLGGSWKVNGGRGLLTLGKRRAQFVRDQPLVVVAGQKLGLAAAPRISDGAWLLPEDFLTKGLGRLAPGVTAAAVEAPKPRAKPAKAAVALEEMRFRSYPSYTRVVVETGATLSYAMVPGEGEIRVRLPRLGLDAARADQVADGMVKEVRLEPAGSDSMLRIVLEGEAGQVKTSTLEDPFRVVLDVYRPREAPESRQAGPAMEPLQRIVLDAGHGGHDPGATGPSGVREKDVVLDVTRRVARLVEEELGVKVVLTRGTDVFVPLRERTNLANKQRGDLFVSIHANAHPRAVSEGVEVYFLSSEASDREARQVAAIENGVIQLETPVSRQKGDVLKTILWDLAQSEFQHESSSMAETVLDSMTRSLRLVPRGVKQAGFYVLGGAAMPAILIEIGFLTNQKEERKLATPEYRAGLARAIVAGLAEYKERHDQRMRTAQTVPVRAERSR